MDNVDGKSVVSIFIHVIVQTLQVIDIFKSYNRFLENLN